jgi:1-acyl-sn-glycerol-3-phosphate acyltransferase
MSGKGEIRFDRWGRAPGGSSIAPFRALYRNWFRVEWEGLENVPPGGGGLIVSNHAGILPVDGAIISLGIEEETGRPVHALAHHGFWRFPFVGNLIARAGGVVGHPENAHRLLTEEKSLVLVFPEGAKGPLKRPRERYRLQRFGRGGFVETALRAGVPIVPIALMGTEDTTPMITTFSLAGQEVPLTLNALLFGPLLGAFVHLPAKIRARVLSPIHFDQPPNRDSYPRSLLMDRGEAIRDQLQHALNDMLRQRRSIFRG